MQDLLAVVVVTDESRWRGLDKLRNIRSLVDDSKSFHASAQTGFRTTLHHDGGMPVLMRIVPNIELCDQNECKLFVWFVILINNHIPYCVTSPALYVALEKVVLGWGLISILDPCNANISLGLIFHTYIIVMQASNTVWGLSCTVCCHFFTFYFF